MELYNAIKIDILNFFNHLLQFITSPDFIIFFIPLFFILLSVTLFNKKGVF